jgi:hypothetical protein
MLPSILEWSNSCQLISYAQGELLGVAEGERSLLSEGKKTFRHSELLWRQSAQWIVLKDLKIPARQQKKIMITRIGFTTIKIPIK